LVQIYTKVGHSDLNFFKEVRKIIVNSYHKYIVNEIAGSEIQRGVVKNIY